MMIEVNNSGTYEYVPDTSSNYSKDYTFAGSVLPVVTFTNDTGGPAAVPTSANTITYTDASGNYVGQPTSNIPDWPVVNGQQGGNFNSLLNPGQSITMTMTANGIPQQPDLSCQFSGQ